MFRLPSRAIYVKNANLAKERLTNHKLRHYLQVASPRSMRMVGCCQAGMHSIKHRLFFLLNFVVSRVACFAVEHKTLRNLTQNAAL